MLCRACSISLVENGAFMRPGDVLRPPEASIHSMQGEASAVVAFYCACSGGMLVMQAHGAKKLGV